MATTYSKVMLDPTQRAGFLTQGTFLASHAGPDQTSPVRRGKFVCGQLLCQTVPPPPDDVVIIPPQYHAPTTAPKPVGPHQTAPPCQTSPPGIGSPRFGAGHSDPP